MGPRQMRTRMYGPGFLGQPAPQEMAFGDDLMMPDMSGEQYGNHLRQPDLGPGGGLASLGAAARMPEQGQVSGRERAGAFLLDTMGHGGLGKMLMDRRQRQLEDTYRREMEMMRMARAPGTGGR